MSNKLISGIVAGVVSLAVALLAIHSVSPSLNAGGTVENFPSHFTNGLFVGTTDQLSIDSSGAITTTGLFTVSAGTDLRGQLIQTGTVASIASGSTHYTAAQFCDNAVVRQNISGAPSSSQLATWPTAAALVADCIPTAGDSRTFVFQNTSNDALERITMTANTGIDFFVASGSAKTLDRKDTMVVRFWNVNGASVSASFIKVEDTD